MVESLIGWMIEWMWSFNDSDLLIGEMDGGMRKEWQLTGIVQMNEIILLFRLFFNRVK